MRIQDGAGDNEIGGTAKGAGNRFSEYGQAAVEIKSGRRNLVLGNRFDRPARNAVGAPLIDLGGDGVTPNDKDDLDTGPNGLQNYPVIDSASMTGGKLVVKGSLGSRRNANFVLEFYHARICGAKRRPKAATPIRTMTVRTDGKGNATFAVKIGVSGLRPGHFVAATATDWAVKHTSELSKCVVVK